jgi:hypothetical protein
MVHKFAPINADRIDPFPNAFPEIDSISGNPLVLQGQADVTLACAGSKIVQPQTQKTPQMTARPLKSSRTKP